MVTTPPVSALELDDMIIRLRLTAIR